VVVLNIPEQQKCPLVDVALTEEGLQAIFTSFSEKTLEWKGLKE
jgi:hypothetical protein